MTHNDYQQLKRFQTNHQLNYDEFLKTLHFPENVIFECYTLSENIKYVHIKNSFEGMFFDIVECNPEGGPVRFPYKRGSTRKEEIAERLYLGDWRFFKHK